jgi:hypothetical protein
LQPNGETARHLMCGVLPGPPFTWEEFERRKYV